MLKIELELVCPVLVPRNNLPHPSSHRSSSSGDKLRDLARSLITVLGDHTLFHHGLLNRSVVRTLSQALSSVENQRFPSELGWAELADFTLWIRCATSIADKSHIVGDNCTGGPLAKSSNAVDHHQLYRL